MYFDYGHMRGQNKPADTALLRKRINAWIDHYVLAKGARPRQDVTVLTQTCPSTAKSGGPFTARNWDALSPGQLVLRSKATQTVASDGGDPNVSKTFDPVLGGGACATTSTASESGTASYLFRKARGKGYTMIGSPLIQAKMAISGSFPVLTGRLFDVAPDGAQTLVARNVFRPADGARSLLWQLNANAWHFARGHRPRIADPRPRRPLHARLQRPVLDRALERADHAAHARAPRQPHHQGAPPAAAARGEARARHA